MTKSTNVYILAYLIVKSFIPMTTKEIFIFIKSAPEERKVARVASIARKGVAVKKVAVKKETKVDSIERAREVIKKILGRSGSEARHNSSPDALIAKMTGKRLYITAGLYSKLSAGETKMVNDPEFRKKAENKMTAEELATRKAVVDRVLKAHASNAAGVYIQISEKGMAILTSVSEGIKDDATASLVVSDMFEYQERVKISGNLAR